MDDRTIRGYAIISKGDTPTVVSKEEFVIPSQTDSNKKYKVLYETSSFNHIMKQKKSFFINQSVLKRNKTNLSSDKDLNMFTHPILAVSINPTVEIRQLVSAIKNTADSFC